MGRAPNVNARLVPDTAAPGGSVDEQQMPVLMVGSGGRIGQEPLDDLPGPQPGIIGVVVAVPSAGGELVGRRFPYARERPRATRLTLLAALPACRECEITDTLVDLLIATVHRTNARMITDMTA